VPGERLPCILRRRSENVVLRAEVRGDRRSDGAETVQERDQVQPRQ
jgi:hypothetical protein